MKYVHLLTEKIFFFCFTKANVLLEVCDRWKAGEGDQINRNQVWGKQTQEAKPTEATLKQNRK